MRRQVFVACLCFLLGLRQISAIVNSLSESTVSNNTVNTTNVDNNTNDLGSSSSTSSITDSIAESSEQETNRREAPNALSNSYGVPFLHSQDSYVPSSPGNLGLPIPVYGVPDAPSNNVIYPLPPPDIPPPVNGPLSVYGPPKEVHPIPLPPQKYGPPRPVKPQNFESFNLPKPFYGQPPRQYGVPYKPLYIPTKISKPQYIPPLKIHKQQYRPPKPLYLPSKHINTYGPPAEVANYPNDAYGPPQNIHGPLTIPIAYGPPEPVPHGPPHPGVPAPPTPPDIKYDGWQPIPGLISRPSSGSYAVSKGQSYNINDLQYNSDFIPPPAGESHKGSGGVSDSYGAPLNTVTGSGGVISTSGDDHRSLGQNSGAGTTGIPFSSFGVGSLGGHGGSGISLVKSIGYEIFPNSLNIEGGIEGFGNNGFISGSYGVPPLNNFGVSHSYNLDGIDNFASQIASTFDTTLLEHSNPFAHKLSDNIGLIPPSGVYGMPPSGTYGTPLLQPPTKFGGVSNVGLNQPKRPVVFREPVPAGLIESIGNSVIQKDAQGIIEKNRYNNYIGPAYVPPPVPDISKPIKEEQEEPVGPSNLYSLPSKDSISFQNYVHGSANAGLNADFSHSYNFNGAVASQLKSAGGSHTTYTAPRGYTSSVSGSYGVPYFTNYQNVGHDCSQKSQPLSSLAYQVPAASTYTASLASLNTNILGAHRSHLTATNYDAPDLQASSSINTIRSNNLVETQKEEETGKALAANFGFGSELVKSQSVDLNNIPLQGSLGSYSLQIQSADGGRGASNIPHDQVLNDGLLQSILNAIEQPQQNAATILGQPLLHLQQIPVQPVQSISINASSHFGPFEDVDGQHSITQNVVVTPPPLQSVSTAQSSMQENASQEVALPLIGDNEIALYFNNNPDRVAKESNKDAGASNVLNGQQYGSYVSFRNQNSSFAYGDLQLPNITPRDLKSTELTI